MDNGELRTRPCRPAIAVNESCGLPTLQTMSNGVENVVTVCPSCGVRYRVDAAHAGKHVRCKKCSVSFAIPGHTEPQDRHGTSRAKPVFPVRSAIICGSVAVAGLLTF